VSSGARSAGPDAGAAGRLQVGTVAGACAVFVGVTVLLVASPGAGVPFLLSGEPFDFGTVWALASNALLFAAMGWVAYLTLRSLALARDLDRLPWRIDLLEPDDAKLAYGFGLRIAFFWLAGSTLASFLFVDLAFSWMTGVFTALTIAVGTAVFLLPVVRVARHIRAEKERELTRVRDRIRAARDAALEGRGPGDPGALPGLLAYEQRVADAREWPIDASSLLRFGLLVTVAVGSWLGGAVTERLLDHLLG